MSNAKHTPGPWILDITPAVAPCCFIIRAKSETCGALVPVATIHNSTRTEANARLIAAAPDLLAALEQVIETIDALKQLGADLGRGEHGDTDEVWNAASAAIAKAKGDA